MAGLMFGTKGMKAFGRYGSIGFELIGSIAVGYYLGRWLDGKFGTHWIAFVGFLLGVYTGFRALFRVAKTMQRDIERDEALERGEDPWAPKSRADAEDAEDEKPAAPRPAVATPEKTPAEKFAELRSAAQQKAAAQRASEKDHD